jgi:transcriptional regulator with XRE-family HTH domain
MKVPEVGSVVRAYRKASGVSQKDLAAMVGISRATLNYLESGRDLDIGAVKLLALLEVLGVPIVVPAPVDRAADDRVLERAAKAAGSGKTRIPRGVLVEALATGRVPDGAADGMRVVLDGCDTPTALAIVRSVAASTGQAPKRVWKHARAVATAVQSTRQIWLSSDE